MILSIRAAFRIRTFVLSVFLGLPVCHIAQQTEPAPPPGMVLIPGGTFSMGSDDNVHSDAYPSHAVTIGSFYMDAREVTNQEYASFCEATGHRLPEFWGMDIYKSGPEYPDHPVCGVSHYDAVAYADWAGKRLPTEAEWEYAARGSLEGMSFPYGDTPLRLKARYNDPAAEKGPVPAGSFEPNGFGLYDMSGNVWEWVADWYSEEYYSHATNVDPTGPPGGQFRVFRGGGWHSGASCTRVHHRNGLPPNWVDMSGGFRCAQDL